jgi:spore coat polysaccharide biosynthesis protein SpsF (cytidylyltransferase family)
MTVGAIIQARTGSTRLPGKVLLDIEGMSMLARVVDRVRRAATIDRIVIATTANAQDDPLAAHAGALSVDVFRGDEDDVLDRYYRAATQFELDVIVRITSDCPLLDPGLLDRVVTLARESRVDYAADTLPRRFPRGLDVEVFPVATLERVWREATTFQDRAHVTPYVLDHPAAFSTAGITDAVDRSHMRWTVDTPEDLTFVREVYRELATRDFTWTDVLNVLDRRPELLQINALVRQKAAHER